MVRKTKSIIFSLDKEVLKTLIEKSNSVSDVMRHFGLECDGANFRQLYKRADKEGLNSEIEALKLRGKNASKTKIINFMTHDLESFKKLLKKESQSTSNFLKKFLLKFSILKNECCICNQNEIWNNKILVLQLDHINGDRHDNRLENLRILCPNCHTQTTTYAGKRNAKHYNCKKCGIETKGFSNNCKKCAQNNCKKFEVSKQELETLIAIHPFTKIGKMFGVTDNSIRKRAKKLGIKI